MGMYNYWVDRLDELGLQYIEGSIDTAYIRQELSSMGLNSDEIEDHIWSLAEETECARE